MKNSAKQLVLAAALGVAVALSACTATTKADGTKTSGAAPTAMTWVTTGNAPRSMQMAMYAVPVELGYFKEENIDVDLRFSEGSTAGIQAVVSGVGLLTNADAGAVLSARGKNIPVKAFGGVVANWPWKFAVAPDSGITSIKDLKGKNIGIISLASGSNEFARAALSDEGIDPDKDVKLLPVGAGAGAAQALSSKKVDALALYGEVYVTMEIAGQKLTYLDNPSRFNSLYSIAFVTTDANLQKEAATITAFGRAAYKGLVFASENPEAAVDIALKVFPDLKEANNTPKAKQDLVAVMREWLRSAAQSPDSPGTWKNIGNITPDQWRETSEYTAASGKELPKNGSADVWTDALLPKINDFDPGAVAKSAKAYPLAGG